MVTLKLLRMIWPTLCSKSPQLRREPGIQNVLILMDMMTAALWTDISVFHKSILPATIIAVEHRNAVTPPKLPGDIPVTEILHPGEVGLSPTLWVEGNLTVFNYLCCRLFELINGNKPLLREPWLKSCAAAVAMHNGVIKVFNVIKQAMLFKPSNNSLTSLISIKTRKLTVTVNNNSVLIKDVDLLKVMSLTHSKVIRVMSWSYLNKTGTKACINMPVREDWNLSVNNWQDNSLSNKISLFWILRRNSYARITQHGLWTSSSYGNVLNAINRLFEWIAQVPKMALLVSVLCLIVRDRSLAMRTPVYDALSAINKLVMIPVNKDLTNSLSVLRRHGELLVIKINGAAHALNLRNNGSAVLARPIPASIQEFLATNLQARNTL